MGCGHWALHLADTMHDAMPPTMLPTPSALPPDDALRLALHDEVHARPSAQIQLPAWITFIAVLNDGVTREAECEHLRRLPGQPALPLADLQRNFLRLELGPHTVKWERHTEFTRYSIVQSLPVDAPLGADWPQAPALPVVEADWLRQIPGRTIAAIELALVEHDLADAPAVLARAQAWFGHDELVASRMGASQAGGGHPADGHSCAITDFRLRADGFERMLVVAAPGTSQSRAGRISQRLLEIETYRLMALRGLPVAKALAPMLAQAEAALADITAQLESAQTAETDLLHTLIALAARVERATAEQGYRFSATPAYDSLVRQRIAELREKAIPGTQTMGEFMQRRLSPAMATVAATAQRLGSLSQRVERTSALLRTRVDIAAEAQNQQLLARLTRGQAMQLRLQSTVEGLSIAAISYYVVSLVLYAGKAAKAGGMGVNPELLAGASVPLVLWAVWRATRRIHERLK